MKFLGEQIKLDERYAGDPAAYLSAWRDPLERMLDGIGSGRPFSLREPIRHQIPTRHDIPLVSHLFVLHFND
jgi:hypothetical protein